MYIVILRFVNKLIVRKIEDGGGSFEINSFGTGFTLYALIQAAPCSLMKRVCGSVVRARSIVSRLSFLTII